MFRTSRPSDVLIVGAWPASLTLTPIFTTYGLRVTILDRQAVFYPLLRAVNLSHDIARNWGLGLHDVLFEGTVADIRATVSDEVEIIGATGEVLRRVSNNGSSKTGTGSMFRLYQPALEKVLETACQQRHRGLIPSMEVENVIDVDYRVQV